MKRGLIIGKFMPVHKGHVALINFAAAQCDELIVSMSYTDHDPISPELRFSWIKEIFADQLSIIPAMVKDDFDDESIPLIQRTKIWSDFISRTYLPIDIIFSSEPYGEPFAVNLGATHVLFDPDRINVPVSSTRIRQNPFQNWDYIPTPVRPFFVKKICIYGPESTGKSTMAIRLAERYHTEFVPEVAREFLTTNDFTVDDIITIGLAHDARVDTRAGTANKILFCDTDVITTQIYSRHYLGVVPDVLLAIEKKTHYAQYFLLDIDIAWVPDGLRDLGHQREQMMTVFRDALEIRKIPFIPVSGTFETREQIICAEIDRLLA